MIKISARFDERSRNEYLIRKVAVNSINRTRRVIRVDSTLHIETEVMKEVNGCLDCITHETPTRIVLGFFWAKL